MKSLESSKDEIIRISNEILDDDENDIMNRYDVEEKRLNQNNFLLIRRMNKKKLPLLFYIYIISVLLFLSFFIYFLVQYINKDENYKYVHDKIIKPPLSKYKYSNLTFDNGLEVLLIQVSENDTAGGSIIFDVGNLDNQYQYKNLDIALSSILNDFNNNNNDLDDYLGKLQYAVDEYYSYFSFEILNAGFFKYLETFRKLTYFDDERLKRIQEKVKKANNTDYSKSSIETKEKFFFGYMVYGCKNLLSENENSIINSRETETIKKIIESILQPKRMKIILGSHFKPSMMKKKFLYYFKDLINSKNNIEKKSNYYNESNFSKKIIIYYNISSPDTNYLKINYFIDKDENENYNEFIKKLGYFNYIKYILDDTDEGSLYYQLTKSVNFSIKSLSCDYEGILKNKIKFSIKINLAPSSYSYLEDIIFLTYQYVNNIVKLISKEKDNYLKKIQSDINIINRQNFTFTEDSNDIKSFSKSLGIKVWEKRNKENFFKDNWIQSFNFPIANELFSQLVPNNSVIIMALDSNAKNGALHNKSGYNFIDFAYLFANSKNLSIYRVKYSSTELKTEFEKYFNDVNINMFHDNKYISKYEEPIKTDEYDKKHFKFTTETLYTNISREFKYLKDTRYRIPKVHIVLNIYHPFIRPQNEEKERNCIYFEFILFLVYIKREINEKLSDAIRAGNKFTIDHTQNNIYINIFAFSDVAKDIVSIVKEIIIDNFQNFENLHDNKDLFRLYMQSAMDDYINMRRISNNAKEKFFLYYSLNPYLYKYNDFPIEYNNISLLNNTCFNVFGNIKMLLASFIIDCQIYGFYEKNQALKIIDLLKQTNKDEEEYFNLAIESANLTDFNLTINNFKNWAITEIIKNEGEKDKKSHKEIISRNFAIQKYRYIFWDNYTIVNRVKSTIYKKVLDHLDKYNNISIKFELFYYNNIYLLINLEAKNISKYDNKIYEPIRKKILEVYKDKSKIFEKKVDVVGSKLYYLIKNTIDYQFTRIKDMESNALTLLNSNLFKEDNLDYLNSQSKKLKHMKYKELYKKLETIYDNTCIDLP